MTITKKNPSANGPRHVQLINGLTWRYRLISVDEKVDDLVGEIVKLAHAECVVVRGAHEGEVLRPDGVLGVLDLEDSGRGLLQMLLLALLLLLHAIRASAGEVGVELRMLVVWCASVTVRLLIASYLVLPIVVHRLDLLLQPLVLFVVQVLFILGSDVSYIYYHECRDGD